MTKITTEEQFHAALARYREVVRLSEERRVAVDRETAVQRRVVQDLELAALVSERSTLSNAIARYTAGIDAPEGIDGPVVVVSASRCHDCRRPITQRATVTRAPIAGRWQWALVICSECQARIKARTAAPRIVGGN